jgi:iron complex outermembrane receptor protein
MKSSAAQAALKPHRIGCDRQKTSRKSATLHTLTLGALVGLLHAPASHSQTLPEVVISATRAQQQSFDAPAAIQAVGREAIEDGGAQINLSESLKRVPGLTILNRQNYAQDLQLSIRGFGARSTFGIRGIRLLIDGIPATTPDGQAQGSSIALTSTDRIEVLRGPLAQLYGNAAGGVIQAFSREAPEQAEWNAQVFGGSFGLNRSDWQFAGKLGQVGLLADYSTLRVDGYRQNSQTERKQFNGKLAFDLSPSTRVHVSLNLFDMPLAQDPIGLDKDQWRADPTQAGVYVGQYTTRKTGTYEVQLPIGSLAEQVLLTQQTIVRVPALEIQRPQRNDPLLSELASKTGGKYSLGLSGLDTIVSSIKPREQVNYLPNAPDNEFRQRLNALLMALIAGALSLEWLTRRLSRLA